MAKLEVMHGLRHASTQIIDTELKELPPPPPAPSTSMPSSSSHTAESTSSSSSANSPLLKPTLPSMMNADLTSSILRKTDTRLLPFLSLLFLFSSLDRSNLGNAETASFTRDAGLQPSDLNAAITAFFIAFVVLQPVGAALGRRLGGERFVPWIMIFWGALTGFHAFVGTRAGLIGLRLLIGVFEAGFYPTTVFYLSLFYTRYEFAQRLGIFYGTSSLAGAVGGVVAYLVFKFSPPLESPPSDTPSQPTLLEANRKGLHSWQILFLLESGLTMSVAIIGLWYLPKGPGNAWFLNRSERAWADTRIAIDRGEQEETRTSRKRKVEMLSRIDVYEAILDWKVWYILAVNILSAIPCAAFSIFLPLVIKGLGFSSVAANLMTVPPFTAAFAVLYIFTKWSDFRRERIIPILVALTILLINLSAVCLLPTTGAFALLRYLALCGMLSGAYIASPLMVAFLNGNIEEPGKRAIVLGINGWGNFAGVISAYIFQPKYGPAYLVPFRWTFILVLVAFAGFAVLRMLLVAENKRRKRILQSWTQEEIDLEREEGRGPIVNGWVRRRMGLEGRRGDERLTFVFGV